MPSRRFEPKGAGAARQLRINERIRASEVLLIGEEGERLGQISVADALAQARERDLDLVEVAPNAAPPVCRILDYGKYKYEQAKRERGAKHQHHGELREVRFKVKISDHDMDMKVRRAARFLGEGDKVKLSVMFRGREILHQDLGRAILQRCLEFFGEGAVVEKPPTMEGRFMNMILAPGKSKPQPEATEDAPPTQTKVAAEG